MNIYLFELKAQLKSFIVWTAVFLALLVLLMVAVYPIFYDSKDAMNAALQGFPPEFVAAFGMTMDDIFSYGGFFAFSFLYFSLMGAIMAATLGISVFSREKRAKCTDFLLTKPRARMTCFTAKLLSSLTVLLAMNILFVVTALILYRNAGQDAALTGRAALGASGLFFMQLVFLAIAVFAATFAKKIRSVSGIATAIGFGGFIMSALHSILEEEALRYVAPMKYFDVSAAFSKGSFETKYVVTAAVVTILLLAAACVKYCRSDVHTV